jgi:hypothetical protein
MLVCDYCKQVIKKNDVSTKYSFPERCRNGKVLSWYEPSDFCEKCAIELTKKASILVVDETITNTVKDLMKDPRGIVSSESPPETVIAEISNEKV